MLKVSLQEMNIKLLHYIFSGLLYLPLSGCLHDKYEAPSPAPASGYPADIDAIIMGKCAIPGCHNASSSSTSGSLNLTTLENLMNGSINGSVIIPFRSDLSSMLYFTNVDSSLGIIQIPTMPVNSPPLSTQEYITLKNWIIKGAPDKNGIIPFSDNPYRKKFYVINEGCDLLSVFDEQSGVVMRYYDIGINAGIKESPYDMKVTPDGKYLLIVFDNADIVQMISTDNDSVIANISIGDGLHGSWHSITVSGDSRKAYALDSLNGRIVFIDLLSKTSFTTQSYAGALRGVALNKTDDTLYVTEDNGNHLFILPVNDTSATIVYNLRSLIPEPGTLMIHDVEFTPDYSKFFITCANVNQVWAFDASTNNLLDTFHVMDFPQEIAISKSTNYLFVTCGIGNGVEVLDYNNLTHITRIPVGESPHGIAVDEAKQCVYVTNRTGHAHHPAICTGVNGSMSTIRISTLERLVQQAELSVDPIQIAIKP